MGGTGPGSWLGRGPAGSSERGASCRPRPGGRTRSADGEIGLGRRGQVEDLGLQLGVGRRPGWVNPGAHGIGKDTPRLQRPIGRTLRSLDLRDRAPSRWWRSRRGRRCAVARASTAGRTRSSECCRHGCIDLLMEPHDKPRPPGGAGDGGGGVGSPQGDRGRRRPLG